MHSEQIEKNQELYKLITDLEGELFEKKNEVMQFK